MTEHKLTQSRLRELVHYDEETGIFTWVGHRCSTLNGRSAGYHSSGSIRGKYRVIRINKVQYLAHRLVWLYVYGRFPDGHIDHRNGDGADNRISNLRECTQTENLRNKCRQSNNKSGVLGVCKTRNGKWRAYVNVGGRHMSKHGFVTVEEAADARRELAALHYGEYAYEMRNHE